MSTELKPDLRTDSPVVRFLDSFLDEKNIKWVLSAGMLILLGSSVMMVTRGWDQFQPTWKFSIVVAYTAVIFGAGHWSYHKLALRKTGTALLALTVLLIPVSFTAWHWLWREADSSLAQGTAMGLLILNTVVAAVASRKTFHHFLQGHQLTFLVSYLVLSLSAAVAPGIAALGSAASVLGALLLWAVFAVGVVKVNRHVFWLMEEHRRPRIFGFFPIVLLGMQFLLVFAVNFASAVQTDWLGLACVLVAIPVLLTADAVARVFQQRTGNLVRPVPWPIMLPLVVGLVLCLGGIALATSGMAHGTPYALVPTAIATAAVMAAAARRTTHRAFVWAMLVSIVLAYNFTPVFFQDVVRTVQDFGARAVSESRLPYAFYGLTYLPLIFAMSMAAAWFRQHKIELFAKPMQQFCFAISTLLLAAAFGHAKALLPVAGVMVGVFALQATLFRERRLALAGVAAFLIASLGVTPFVSTVLNVSVPAQALFSIPSIAAGLLLAASPLLDRRIAAIPMRPGKAERAIWEAMCRTSSLVATIGLGLAWLIRWNVLASEPAVLTLATLGVLLVVQSLVWKRASISWLVYVVFVGEFIRWGIASELYFNTLASLATLFLGAQWGVSYLFDRYPLARASQAWAEVNQTTSLVGLLTATLFFVLPDMVVELGWFTPSFRVDTSLWWIRDIVLVVWCFDAARRPQRLFHSQTSTPVWERRAQPIPAFLGCLTTLGLVGCGLVRVGGPQATEWLPVAWTVCALLAIPVVQWLRRRAEHLRELPGCENDYHAVRAISLPVDITTLGVCGLFAAMQLFIYTGPLRIAGYSALAGLLWLATDRRQPLLRTATVGFLNWTVLLTVIQFCVPDAWHAVELLQADFSAVFCLLAALASSSALLWQLPWWREADASKELALVQRLCMRLIGGGALILTFGEGWLGTADAVLAGVAFAGFVISELWSAARLRDELRVWTAEAVVAVAGGFYCWFGVLDFENSMAMFAVLGAGVILYVAGMLAIRRDETRLFVRPFVRTGQWMPLATVGIGIFRHIVDAQTVWHGANSLAILAAGGFYFWQAIERKSKGLAVLSAAILNVALMLLWNELRLSDPQFYMIPIGVSILVLVEVLKREINAAWHNPLRYAGALTILVSPTFHIVGGSWLHLLTLMIASTSVLLISIGLRIRALMYAGTAFLVADLAGMVVRGGIDNPNLLWIAGIAFGAAVVLLGAYCEHNREKLLQRMRIVSAQLGQWS